jgi:hypothetical protein
MFMSITAQWSVLLKSFVRLSISVGSQKIFQNKFKIFMKKSRKKITEKIGSFLDLMKLFDDNYNIKDNMV